MFRGGRTLITLLALAGTLAALPAAASATTTKEDIPSIDYPGIQHLKFKYGPIDIKPGQNDIRLNGTQLKPKVPGYITRFKPSLVNEDGSMQVTTDMKPKAVKLWQATNPKTRYFRVDRICRVWKSKDLEPAADGTYSGGVEKPAEGYTAYMIELTYDNPGSPPFKVTTQVKVIPDVLPFEYKQPTPPIEVEAAAKAEAAAAGAAAN